MGKVVQTVQTETALFYISFFVISLRSNHPKLVFGHLHIFFTREGPNESILLLGHVVDSDGKRGAKLQSIVWRSKSPLLVLAM